VTRADREAQREAGEPQGHAEVLARMVAVGGTDAP
jgi:hypothetical protein